MVSPSRAKRYSDDQAKVVKLAHRELDAFWRTLDKSSPVAAKAALQDFMVVLVEGYGPISSTLAADYYDEIREAAAAPRRFTARPLDAVNVEQVRSSAAWAAQPMFNDNPNGARERLLGIAQRYVQEAGRNTISRNADRDPAKPRWARVPMGDTCAWCLMLASRGAEYHSEASAGGMEQYHDGDCDCQPVVVFDGDSLPYDADALFDQYKDAAKKADGPTARDVTSKMRELGIGSDKWKPKP